MKADDGPQASHVWCTALAWACCAVTIWTTTASHGTWWSILVGAGLSCLSFVVSISIDVARLQRWAGDGATHKIYAPKHDDHSEDRKPTEGGHSA